MRVLQAANPFAVWSLRRALSEFRPDIVHVRMFKTQLSPFILPVIRGTPSLYHVGSYQSICPLNTKLLPDGSLCRTTVGHNCYKAGCLSSLGLLRVTLQHGAWRRWRGILGAVISNSRWLATRLEEDGIDVDAVIPNGTPIRPARPSIKQPPTVAFAGRLVPEKGVRTLLHAMVLVAAKIPESRLFVAGDGPYRAAVDSELVALGLHKHVSMLGHLSPEPLAQKLSEAWVQVVPSCYEDPFPNVIVEAMMRGTAVVASAIGGASEIVRHGLTGYLVPPNDAHELAARIVCLLQNRIAAEKMGAYARELALSEYSDDLMVKRFVERYHLLRASDAFDGNRRAPSSIALESKPGWRLSR
jgi:glycosyltransferase involved in cell wall biosynthesis